MYQLLTCFYAVFLFTGSSKRRRKEELLGKPFRRPQHELDSNGLVPLPVKVCFSCNRLAHGSLCVRMCKRPMHVYYDQLLCCSLPQELSVGSPHPVRLLPPSVPHGLPGPPTHSFTCWKMDVSKPCWALSGKRLVHWVRQRQLWEWFSHFKVLPMLSSWIRGASAWPGAVSSLSSSRTGCPSTRWNWTSCGGFTIRTRPTDGQHTSTTRGL